MNLNALLRASRIASRARLILWLGLLLAGSAQRLFAWTPGTGSPNAAQGFVVDPTNRTDVLSFYNCIYTASENYAADMMWTGNVGSGVAGTTSAAFKDDVRRRINFYRALVALPADIFFDGTKSNKCQQAALMMSRNNALNHAPPMSWLSYTADGAEAAMFSNLTLGVYGPAAINFLMRDFNSGTEVGHRRWFLYSRAQSMGTGDIPDDPPYAPAHATWVIGDQKPAPATQFVAWPNRGYSPFPLLPERWSLSYPDANFSSATVTMTQGGNNVPVTIISNNALNFGDNSIVWLPSGLPSSLAADTSYNVTVSGISGAGIPASYSYTVTLFDPNVLGNSATITGSSTPPTTGATYSFNSIAQADSHQLQVSTGSNAAWTEGAETASPLVVDSTAASYDLLQTDVKRTGNKAFHLTFPTFEDGAQSFEIARDLVPTAASLLTFYDLFRFVTTASRLSAEISPDNGSTWIEVFGRNGNGSTTSAGWDTVFQSRSVSLATWAGVPVRIRFIFRDNNSAFLGTSNNLGVFLDDISVSNATQLLTPTVTTLAGAATSFTLNATSAGAPLVAGTTYYLRIRPNVGCRWFSYGALKAVTAQTPTGYAAWVSTQYPTVTEGPLGNHDGDSHLNGIEYTFGLNPTVIDSAHAVPQPIRTGNSFGVTFVQPVGITGVTYAAEWSPNLTSWTAITDTGGGTTHAFNVSTVSQPTVFFRFRITIAP